MPSKAPTRPVRESSVGGPLSREQKEFLLAGWGLGGEFPDEAAMKTAWEENRAELMAEWFTPRGDYTVDPMHWKEHGLGTRPFAWWKFDAPEPRKVLRGPGIVEPPNVPKALYESEASYLFRLNLLTREEKAKLTPRDFNSTEFLPVRYRPTIETR